LLKFLQVLRWRFGLHLRSSEETGHATAVMPVAVLQPGRKDMLFRIETQSSSTEREGKEKALSRW